MEKSPMERNPFEHSLCVDGEVSLKHSFVQPASEQTLLQVTLHEAKQELKGDIQNLSGRLSVLESQVSEILRLLSVKRRLSLPPTSSPKARVKAQDSVAASSRAHAQLPLRWISDVYQCIECEWSRSSVFPLRSSTHLMNEWNNRNNGERDEAAVLPPPLTSVPVWPVNSTAVVHRPDTVLSYATVPRGQTKTSCLPVLQGPFEGIPVFSKVVLHLGQTIASFSISSLSRPAPSPWHPCHATPCPQSGPSFALVLAVGTAGLGSPLLAAPKTRPRTFEDLGGWAAKPLSVFQFPLGKKGGSGGGSGGVDVGLGG
ncbi:unnamed protein product [Pleuronectes platessa]|uniref:Uncharacterized protein n=1 Tax=Pleuronectes platessa TaxID=8262 RepID=A0A9N7TJK2_PLEPL|nr:unnamed protein product [Pleuronectes platessa]